MQIGQYPIRFIVVHFESLIWINPNSPKKPFDSIRFIPVQSKTLIQINPNESSLIYIRIDLDLKFSSDRSELVLIRIRKVGFDSSEFKSQN